MNSLRGRLHFYAAGRIIKISIASAIVLPLLAFFPLPQAISAVHDPPHNEASGVSCGECHGAGGYYKYDRDSPGPQLIPTLAWTGETNYLSDGVHPNSAIGAPAWN